MFKARCRVLQCSRLVNKLNVDRWTLNIVPSFFRCDAV